MGMYSVKNDIIVKTLQACLIREWSIRFKTETGAPRYKSMPKGV